MKKLIFLIIAVLLLTGCGGYTDASIQPPSNWAEYELGEMHFKFHAGWTREETSGLTAQMESGLTALGGTNTVTMLAAYASPSGEQGAKNYLYFASMTMAEELVAEDLEGIMDSFNDMSRTMKNSFAIGAEITQTARIREYSGMNALTTAYKVSYGEAESLVQLAMVPQGKTLYIVSYADFSTVKDNTDLEQVLTSMRFEE